MTVSLSLPSELEAKLRERATATGKDVSELVSEIVREKLQSPPRFRDVFRPLHEAFQQGNASDDELDSLFEELRDEVGGATARRAP